MELKATLHDYTAAEFKALVDRIWAVDLPKKDHDQLLNHFDRIVGHPKGADLLFYPDDTHNANGSASVVYYVREWHRQRGVVPFRGEDVPVAPVPPTPQNPIARSLASVQAIAGDVAASAQKVEAALHLFAQRIQQLRDQLNVQPDILSRETEIQALERAQHEAVITVRKFESWKMRVEFAKSDAQRQLTYARSDQVQWQSIAQQISATHDHYIAQLASTAQRHRVLHEQAEALLISAQDQLIVVRNLAGTGPTQVACTIIASLAFANKRPDILLVNEPSGLETSQKVGLQNAIRSTVAEFSWQNTSSEATAGNQYSGVLYFGFSSRADRQVYGLSLPLSELMPIEGQDWEHLAESENEIDLPFRMSTTIAPAKPGKIFQGLREIKTLSQVYVTPSLGGPDVPGVRVRLAKKNERNNTFSFTAEGGTPITVLWSDSVPSTVVTSTGSAPLPRLQFVHTPRMPLLENFVDAERPRADDYIVVFPAEAGLDPLYVMFRDRSEYPATTIA